MLFNERELFARLAQRQFAFATTLLSQISHRRNLPLSMLLVLENHPRIIPGQRKLGRVFSKREDENDHCDTIVMFL